MKFSIRDLLLVTMVVALAVGWLVERRQLDFARISAQSESAAHQAELGKVEAQMRKFNDEFQQLVVALGEHGVQIYNRGGRVIVSPESAFADDPIKIEMPTSSAPAPNPPKP